jgi:lipid II:glycine glycyltransferase (peptidoglycan interpeptide bridge formation enzyme)
MNITEKKPEGGLLQSSEWMAVLRAENKYVIDVHDGKEVLYGIEQKLPLVGRYLYFPRVTSVTETLLHKMCALPYPWMRVDANDEQIVQKLHVLPYTVVLSPHDMQPRSNLIVDITKDDDTLLQNMKPKTRYNIRLAQKKGVHVFASKDQKYIDRFHELVMMTAQRKEVTFHGKDHYEKIVQTLSDDMVALYIAEYAGEIIAMNAISFYGKTATYLHGATADLHRNVMAPFLLQWQAMQDARQRGCLWYDFGGVFPDSDDPGKKGITRFKQGFAPEEIFYDTQGSYDIIFSGWRYDLYRTLQKLRG